MFILNHKKMFAEVLNFRVENIARMIYEKFAHRYCETVWLSLLLVSRDLQVDLVEVTEDQQVLQDQEDQLVTTVYL